MKSLENITDDEDFKIEKAERLSLKRKIIDQAAIKIHDPKRRGLAPTLIEKINLRSMGKSAGDK